MQFYPQDYGASLLKPKAFRIHDFKSIKNSGVCELSGDGITVLAGQNEAGKTAILTALRDFDEEPGTPPQTKDYWPDDADNEVRPRVAVGFENDADQIKNHFRDSKIEIPDGIVNWLNTATEIWVERDLERGQFQLSPEIQDLWEEPKSSSQAEDDKGPSEEIVESDVDEVESDVDEAGAGVATNVEAPKSCTPSTLAPELRMLLPNFLYFDTFGHTLPRTVSLSALMPKKTASPTAGASGSPPATVPQAVRDFITLSGIDVNRLQALSSDDKRVDNYLSGKTAQITGDFLGYWKQTVSGEQTVELRVNARRNEEGNLGLNFFVFDGTEHYPDQRVRDSFGSCHFIFTWRRRSFMRQINGDYS
jgi:hypothetical protein